MTFDGDVLESQELDVKVEARSAARLELDPRVGETKDTGNELLVVAFTGEGPKRVIYDFADVVDQRLDPDALEIKVTPGDDRALIDLHAKSYVRDVFVLADRADRSAVPDKGMLSMLAGEEATIKVTASGPLPEDALLDPRVTRSSSQVF